MAVTDDAGEVGLSGEESGVEGDQTEPHQPGKISDVEEAMRYGWVCRGNWCGQKCRSVSPEIGEDYTTDLEDCMSVLEE